MFHGPLLVDLHLQRLALPRPAPRLDLRSRSVERLAERLKRRRADIAALDGELEETVEPMQRLLTLSGGALGVEISDEHVHR